MKINLILIYLVIASQAFGFSEREEVEAYKKLSSCASTSTENRIKHLDYVKGFAEEDEVSLERAVEDYNKLNCTAYDTSVLAVAESVSLSQTEFSNSELLGLAFRLYSGLDKVMHYPSGVLKDTFSVVLSALRRGGSLEVAEETYLSIVSTVKWNAYYSYHEDNQSNYMNSRSPQQASEVILVYKQIWDL